MASRYKWYSCGTSLSVDGFYEKLLSRDRSVGSDSWFATVSDGNDDAAIRFFWTVQVLATTINSGGEELAQSYPVVSFQEFTFFRLRSQGFIRLKNPGKNINGLFNVIEELVGHGFWVKPISLIGNVSEKFQLAVDSWKLIGLKVANLAISNNVVARFEFASKHAIEPNALSRYLERPHIVEFCSYEVLYKNVRAQASFYRNGQVKVSDQLGPFLIKVVEENL